jgi:hypothetical protein
MSQEEVQMNTDTHETATEVEEHRGPPLLAISIVTTVLFPGAMVLTAVLTDGGHLPSPFDPASSTVGFFADNATAVRKSRAEARRSPRAPSSKSHLFADAHSS